MRFVEAGSDEIFAANGSTINIGPYLDRSSVFEPGGSEHALIFEGLAAAGTAALVAVQGFKQSRRIAQEVDFAVNLITRFLGQDKTGVAGRDLIDTSAKSGRTQEFSLGGQRAGDRVVE